MGQLQDAIGLEFNEKVKKAWLKLLGLVVAQMKIGMKQAEETDDSNNTNTNINHENSKSNETTVLK